MLGQGRIRMGDGVPPDAFGGLVEDLHVPAQPSEQIVSPQIARPGMAGDLVGSQDGGPNAGVGGVGPGGRPRRIPGPWPVRRRCSVGR